MQRSASTTLALGVLSVMWLGAGSAAAAPFGPSAYVQQSDSPFAALDFSGGYFYLEDFEDHALDTPGVSGSPGGPTSIAFGPTFHDSVDADDGSIDGGSLAGDSWFDRGASVAFTFDAGVLGALPTHAGLVWTDGPFLTGVTFTAFGSDGVTAVCTIVAPDVANSSFNGETAEDRFFGCSDAGGISRVQLVNALGGGIEADHVQYGRAVAETVPEPAGLALLGVGLALARRRLAGRA